jgi:hypothetical protein
MLKTGMVQVVPWPIVHPHATIVDYVHHQMYAHVLLNGKINSIWKKLFIKIVIIFIGMDQHARYLSVSHPVKIMGFV